MYKQLTMHRALTRVLTRLCLANVPLKIVARCTTIEATIAKVILHSFSLVGQAH